MKRNEAEGVVRDIFGDCLCGNPDVVVEFIHKALRMVRARSAAKGEDWKVADRELNVFFGRDPDVPETNCNPFFWMAWYFVDRGGILEHGGNVSGSWLTDKGKAFLEYLDTHEKFEYQVLVDPGTWDHGIDSKKPLDYTEE